MGSRVQLIVACRAEHAERFADRFGGPECSTEFEAASGAKLVQMNWPEVNYGGTMHLSELCAEGIPFVSSAEAYQGEFGPAMLFSDGKECPELEAEPDCSLEMLLDTFEQTGRATLRVCVEAEFTRHGARCVPFNGLDMLRVSFNKAFEALLAPAAPEAKP